MIRTQIPLNFGAFMSDQNIEKNESNVRLLTYLIQSLGKMNSKLQFETTETTESGLSDLLRFFATDRKNLFPNRDLWKMVVGDYRFCELYLFPMLIVKNQERTIVIQGLKLFLELIQLRKNMPTAESEVLQRIKKKFLLNGSISAILEHSYSDFEDRIGEESGRRSSRIDLMDYYERRLKIPHLTIRFFSALLAIPDSVTLNAGLQGQFIARLSAEKAFHFVIDKTMEVCHKLVEKSSSGHSTKEALSRFLLSITRFQHYVYRYEDPDEVYFACNDKNAHLADSLQLDDFQTIEKSVDSKIKASMSTRHSRFGGAIVRNIGNGKRMIVRSSRDVDLVQQMEKVSKKGRYNKGKIKKKESGFKSDIKVKKIVKKFASEFLRKALTPMSAWVKATIQSGDEMEIAEPDVVADIYGMVSFMIGCNRNYWQEVQDEEYRIDVTFVAPFLESHFLNQLTEIARMAQASKNSMDFLLEAAIRCFKEIWSSLFIMHQSKDVNLRSHAEQILLQFLYDSENSNTLLKLLKSFQPSKFTHKYLCDLIESSGLIFSMIERSNERDYIMIRKKQAFDASSNTKEKLSDKEFDFEWFTKRFGKPLCIKTFSYALKEYQNNPPNVNNHLKELLERISKIDYGQDEDGTGEPRNILFDFCLLYPMYRIVMDQTFLKKRKYHDARYPKRLKYNKNLVKFIKKVFQDFFNAAKENPFVYSMIFFTEEYLHAGAFDDVEGDYYPAPENREDSDFIEQPREDLPEDEEIEYQFEDDDEPDQQESTQTDSNNDSPSQGSSSQDNSSQDNSDKIITRADSEELDGVVTKRRKRKLSAGRLEKRRKVEA